MSLWISLPKSRRLSINRLRKYVFSFLFPELYSNHATSRRYRRPRREGGDPV